MWGKKNNSSEAKDSSTQTDMSQTSSDMDNKTQENFKISDIDNKTKENLTISNTDNKTQEELKSSIKDFVEQEKNANTELRKQIKRNAALLKKEDKKKRKKNKVAKRSFLKPLLLILIILAMGFGIYFFSQQIKAKTNMLQKVKEEQLANKQVHHVKVITYPLQIKPISNKLNFPGEIEAFIEVDINTEVDGKIIAKEIKEGSFVEKDTIIAKIDPDKYQNQYNAAQASYNAADANLKRMKILYKQKLARKADLDSANANLAQCLSSLNISKINLRDCTILAPMAGYINDIFIEKGSFVSRGSIIANIIDISKVKVKVGIPETDVLAVSQMSQFNVKIDALGKNFIGAKSFLSKKTSNLAKLYDLELTIDNPQGEIWPDMFAMVEIIKAQKNAIVLPIFTIISNGDGKNYVYIEKDGTATKREVQLGIQDGWMVEIASGVTANESAIVVGHRNLSDGQKVKVVKQTSNLETLFK